MNDPSIEELMRSFIKAIGCIDNSTKTKERAVLGAVK